MAEMETLAVALSDAGIYDEFDETPLASIAADAALSWLASVLADDATVEVVARALWAERHDKPWGEVSEWFHAYWRRVSTEALAALSAHLTAPARAGDTSGEEGGRG